MSSHWVRGTYAGPTILYALLQRNENASIVGQRCAALTSCSADRKHQVTCTPRRASSSLHPRLGSRYTQPRTLGMRRGRRMRCPAPHGSFFQENPAKRGHSPRVTTLGPLGGPPPMSCRNIGTKRGAVCHLPDLGARNFAKEQLWVRDRCQYAHITAGASHSLLQREPDRAREKSFR
jgi:hypothetical protein